MRPVENARKTGSALALLLAATALASGCSPAGGGKQDGEQSQAFSEAQVKAQVQPHYGGASSHSQPGHAEQDSGPDLGWSKLRNGHEHHAEVKPWEELAPEVRSRLAHQLGLTQRLLGKFATVGAAEAAGYRRAGSYSPGMGVHYAGGGISNRSGTLTDEEILRPSRLMFDGTDKSSRLVGFMYLTFFNGGKGPIDGFAGPYDAWHTHTGGCQKVRPDGSKDALGFDGSITKEECEKAGAVFKDLSSAMVHVWTVPGFESRLGVFSNLNPALKCPDGTYHAEGPAKLCRKA